MDGDYVMVQDSTFEHFYECADHELCDCTAEHAICFSSDQTENLMQGVKDKKHYVDYDGNENDVEELERMLETFDSDYYLTVDAQKLFALLAVCELPSRYTVEIYYNGVYYDDFADALK